MTDAATTDSGESVNRQPAPFWWPDSRGFITVALFILTGVILKMIDHEPKLLDSAPFMQLVGTLMGTGGLGLILSFFFASSSGTAKANERADRAMAMSGTGTGGKP